MQKNNIYYSDCGVDINFAHKAISELHQTRSRLGEVLPSPNDFAGLFSIKDLARRFDDPVLVSGTDGVGTKLLVAIQCENYDSLGQDLVAMCANDIATKGAEPLFFLDYFAAANLKEVPFNKVINAMVQACDQINCALIGGESAEMPGLYGHKHFDLAGFMVGVVEREKMLGTQKVKQGDLLLGLGSSGLHANGFSLVRKIIFDKLKLRPNDVLWQTEKSVSTVADELLKPTKLYVKNLHNLLTLTDGVHAAAHITGGGLLDNIARIIPSGLMANIDLNTVKIPEIFSFLMQSGPILPAEMLRTFNMGIGMVLAVDSHKADLIAAMLADNGEQIFKLGEITKTVNDKKCLVNWL